MSRGRALLFRILAIGLGLLAGAIFLEIFHLASSPSLRRRAGVALDPQACSSSHRRPVWFHDFGVRSVGMLSTLEPFCRDTQFGVSHNSQGFRGRDYTIARPPATHRISMIGDSFTWGQGVGDDETFAAILGSEIERRCDGSCDGSWEVLNHGVQGSRIVDNYMRLLAHVEALSPDLVVVQVFANDLYYSSWEFILPQLDHHDLRTGWLAHVPIVRSIDKAKPAFDMAPLYRRERLRSFAPDTLEWELFITSLDRFAAWSRRASTPIYFVVFPDLVNDVDNFAGYTQMPPEVAVIERATAEIERRGLPHLDIIDVLRRRGADEILALADGHPSAAAHRLAGEALFEDLQDREMLPCADRASRPSDPHWSRETMLRQEAAGTGWRELSRSYALQAAFYEELAALYPENPWIAEQLAYAHLRAGERDRAGNLYRALTELAPDLAAPWTYLAELSSGEPRQANLERMLRLVPDHADALEQLIANPLVEDEPRACEWLTRLLRHARYPAQTRRALAFNRRLRCGDPRALLDPASGG